MIEERNRKQILTSTKGTIMKIEIQPSIEKSIFAQRVYMALLNVAETATARIELAKIERTGGFLRLHIKFGEYPHYGKFAIGDLSTLLGRAGIFVQQTQENPDGTTMIDLAFPNNEFYDIETPRPFSYERKSRRVQIILTPSLYDKAKKQADEADVSFNEFVCHALERMVEMFEENEQKKTEATE